MKNFDKNYPPYSGDEPYIYLCFDAADANAAEAIIKRLWLRGCRVWYPAANSSETENQKHIEKAELVIVVNTEKFSAGKAKRNMMFLQSKGVPVIIVDFIRADVISTGEHAGTVHVSALDGDMDNVEAGIITSEVFSQDFIGPRPQAPAPAWIKGILSLLAALVIAAALFLLLNIAGVIHPKQDPNTVYTLELEHIPADISELEQYPNLETVIIPQSEAENAEKLLEHYTVVLERGNR